MPRTVQWIRKLVAGLSLRRNRFDAGSVHVGFVVEEISLEQDFLQVLRFPLSVSFHACSTRIYVYWRLLAEWQVGEIWFLKRKKCPFWNRKALDTNVLLLFLTPQRDKNVQWRWPVLPSHCEGLNQTPAGVQDKCLVGTVWKVRVFLPRDAWRPKTNIYKPLCTAVF